jgi:hypothetical protein
MIFIHLRETTGWFQSVYSLLTAVSAIWPTVTCSCFNLPNPLPKLRPMPWSAHHTDTTDIIDLMFRKATTALKGLAAPHTYSFTFSFNCAGQTVPSLLSLACERFYHTRAVKPEGYTSVQFVISMGANISMMPAVSELLCYAAIALVLDRKYRRNARKSTHATWCWQH